MFKALIQFLIFVFQICGTMWCWEDLLAVVDRFESCLATFCYETIAPGFFPLNFLNIDSYETQPLSVIKL